MFRFKQFSIQQDKTAMKVGTDGVLLGAWAPLENVQNILDIGTGTGLIAMMLAQRHLTANLTAIEIDEKACEQACENIAASPWSKRIKVHHKSLQAFSQTHRKIFDLIVTNPPFFNNSFHAPEASRAKARQSHLMPHEDILIHSGKLLNKDGALVLILPSKEYLAFCEKAGSFGFHENRRMTIFPTPNKDAVRIMGVYKESRPQSILNEEMVIESEGRHHYSLEYISLTKDFYLKM